MPKSSASEVVGPAPAALVARLRTPWLVQRWMRGLRYNFDGDTKTSNTFFGVFERGTANCFEGAVAAAYVLSFHGYPPLLLYLDSPDRIAHVLFAFRQGGRWGAIGKSRYPAMMGRRPVFRSVRDLAWSYVDPFVDRTGRVESYALLDLSTLGGRDWRRDRYSLRRVDQALDDVPPTPLSACDRRHEAVHRQYLRWREEHGTEPPIRLYRGAQFMW